MRPSAGVPARTPASEPRLGQVLCDGAGTIWALMVVPEPHSEDLVAAVREFMIGPPSCVGTA